MTVKDLLLAEDDEPPIEDIMQTNLIYVTTQTDQEEVAIMFNKYNFLALPVVDGEKRMVGIVTFDDAMDVMEEEATEDMEIMAAMTPSEKSYLKSTPVDLFKHRIPWLMLLMVSATFTGMIITSFESALSLLPALTAFIPMLMGHRRQLRFPVLRHGHPCFEPGRAEAGGYFQGHVEGIFAPPFCAALPCL